MNKIELFKEIRNGNVPYENMLASISDISGQFDIEKLNSLLDDFQRFIKKEKSIRDAGLTIKERFTIYNESNGIKDYEFELCNNFESIIKQQIAQVETNEFCNVFSHNENVAPNIFKDDKAYQFFLALKDEIIRDTSKYADFSFIFSQMSKDGYIHDITHKVFLDFLMKEKLADFQGRYNQFKGGSTPQKLQAYTMLKTRFK